MLRMTAMKNEQLELAILNDVVNRFVHLNEGTARRTILIKYKNQPAAEVLHAVINQNIIRRKGSEGATTDEEYLPAAAAFELCGDTQLLEEAKHASAVVLYTLQQMFVGDPRTGGYTFNVLKEHAALVFPNHIPDDATLKLGLYLARDLHVLMGHRMQQPDQTEVEWFQIAETVANLPNPEQEWDRAMTGYRPSSLPSEPEGLEEAQWEQIRRLGWRWAERSLSCPLSGKSEATSGMPPQDSCGIGSGSKSRLSRFNVAIRSPRFHL